jgi:alkylation response protein AidB-like acyl-CoA dehydrogenase
MSDTRPLPSQEDLDAIREGVRAACAPFGDDYWLDRDDTGEFPRDFHRAMADGGWLGITMPEEYGGSGLGVTEAMTMMNEVASCGGGFAAASTIHINLFGPHPIVVKGTPEQKARWVPWPVTTNAVSASPSPMQASTPPGSRPSPKKYPAAMSSTARRSGPRPRRSRTRSCC